jgi:gliding motility-associated peptidyl-prolyl isomerase
MTYKILSCSVLLFLLSSSCKSPEPRKPITVKTGSFIKASVERNKELNKKEALLIKAVAEQNAGKTIISSNYGFWYFLNNSTKTNDYFAEFGDKVNFDYNIKNLKGEIIYSAEELGTQNYSMDKQEIFTGLREGLKLLNEGQSATFLFPSQKAFGYYGDENKIGANIPIICEVTINKITKN